MQRIRSDFEKDTQIVQSALVNGFMKLWLYQFFLLSRLSWPFLIYDLNLTFAKELQRYSLPLLKKWAGVSRSTDNGLLFRSKGNFGLGITSISDHYKRMQVVKCQLLSNSQDQSIRSIFNARTDKDRRLKRVWRATKLNTEAEAVTTLQLRYPPNQGRRGLGFGPSLQQLSPHGKRKLVVTKALSFQEEARITHAHSLTQQSVWLRWENLAEALISLGRT